MVRSSATVEVEPIDRLEDKVRQMVGMIDNLRSEKARAVQAAAELREEVAALKARLAEGATASAELSTLREEREMIRARVAQMIAQVDALNL